MDFLIKNARLIVFALSSGLFFFLESAWRFKPYGENRFRHIGRNFAVAFLNALLYGILFGALVDSITDMTLREHFGLFRWISLPWNLEVIFSVLLLDLVIYWWHVIAHKIPLIWRFHMVHHSDVVLDFSTGTRFHFGEMIGLVLFHMPFYAILGIQMDALIINQLLLIFFTQLAHANVVLPRNIDSAFRKVFITSNLHHVHHSIQLRERDSNYGTIFSIWDRWFWTYNSRRDVENIQKGIRHVSKHISLKGALLEPFEPQK